MSSQPSRRDTALGPRLAQWLTGAAMVVLAVVFFFPLVWMVLSSFKTNGAIFQSPFALPESIDLSRWAEAWDVGNLGKYAVNSAIVTGASVFLILLIASLAAFAFSRYRFRGRSLALGLFALGLLLPLQSYFIAQSNLFTQLAITDTRWALIIPYTAMGLPLATFLLKVFMDGLPEELFDAARIDGASDLRTYRQVALPLLRPGLATVAIFSALAAWNEFLLALLYIQDDDLKTIPTGLLAFSSRYQTDYSTALLGAIDRHHPDDRDLHRLQPAYRGWHHCRQREVDVHARRPGRHMTRAKVHDLPPMFPGGNRIGREEEEAVLRVLRSKRLFRYYGAVDGPSAVEAFETRFAELVGSGHALAVASGTTALTAALAAAGVGPGDQVIVPAYTWVSTAAAVVAVGAVPVLAEVDEIPDHRRGGCGEPGQRAHPGHHPGPHARRRRGYDGGPGVRAGARPGRHRGRSAGDGRTLSRPTPGLHR